jgi:hypothetical protein
MISNYIFNLLSQDSIDSDADTVLPEYQKRYNDITLDSGQLPIYTYTSLKTLLGETDSTVNQDNIPNWAVRRIKCSKVNIKFREIQDPGDLPLIFVKVSNVRDNPRRVKAGSILASMEIGVHTNPEKSDSSLSWNLIHRINGLFIQYSDNIGIPSIKDIASGETTISGLLGLYVTPQSLLDSAWDVQRCLYSVEARQTK